MFLGHTIFCEVIEYRVFVLTAKKVETKKESISVYLRTLSLQFELIKRTLLNLSRLLACKTVTSNELPE